LFCFVYHVAHSDSTAYINRAGGFTHPKTTQRGSLLLRQTRKGRH
jgi:hypothetical protein